MDATVAIIGGAGRVGRRVVRRLVARNVRVVIVGREERVEVWPPGVQYFRVTAEGHLAEVIVNATHVINCASVSLNPIIFHARLASVQRLVLIGSTRVYTDVNRADWSQMPYSSLAQIEADLEQSGLPGVILHPSLIYGGGDHNISRIASWLHKSAIVPLPNGGRSLIQPVHVEDVAAAIESALFAPDAPGKPIIVAGPRPIMLRDMVRTVARGIGARVLIVPIPSAAMHAAAAIARTLPGLPAISHLEVSRMLEDRAYDVSDLRERLGIVPREFAIDRSILDS